MQDPGLVSRIRSSRDCPAGTIANFGFKRVTRIIGLLVSLRFGSSLRSKLRTLANFRTATLAFRASIFLVAALSLAGCNTDGLGTTPGASPGAFSQPSAPPTPIAGRWLFSSPGRGQCNMTFGSANATAAEGTIAPEAGCPGRSSMSRKWTYDQGGLPMRDHNGQPLAQLSGATGHYDGKAAS